MKTQSEIVWFDGHSGPLKSFLLTPEKSKGLAVVLPGAGYSMRQPLLHFAIQVFLQNSLSVLAIDKMYAEDPRWMNMDSEAKALIVVEKDSIALFNGIAKKFSPDIEILMGRSLGTFAMACALERELVRPKKVIWHCPSLQDKLKQMRDCPFDSFGVIGTADTRYFGSIDYFPTSRLVIEGADHALEIPGDPIKSIEILGTVTAAVADWVSRS